MLSILHSQCMNLTPKTHYESKHCVVPSQVFVSNTKQTECGIIYLNFLLRIGGSVVERRHRMLGDSGSVPTGCMWLFRAFNF